MLSDEGRDLGRIGGPPLLLNGETFPDSIGLQKG